MKMSCKSPPSKSMVLASRSWVNGRGDCTPLTRRSMLVASKMPMTLEEAWVPDALYPDITGLGLTTSLYALMGECYARGPARASERLEAVPARAPEAKLLHVPVGSPLMLVERIAYDEDGTPVEYAKDRHRGDRTTFVVESLTGETAALPTKARPVG